ncbi:MAG: dienelactone hydrolase family protein [Actinomycetota bacterium]
MRIRIALLALALAAAACGGADDDTAAPESSTTTSTTEAPPTSTAAPTTTTTTEAPTTTSEPPPPPTDTPAPVLFSERGPWSVGIVTLDLGDRLADVYYPAIPEPDATTEIFDSLGAFPEELAAFIPEELTGLFDTTAYRDAIPANDEQAFPVLVYSHGFGGFRQVASFHTSHVASWGFVVVTTDHLERGLRAQATNQLGGGADNQDVLDVLNSLDALAAHPDVGPIADLERVAITGHSAGGGTSARAAAEDVIDAYITIAAGSPDIVTQKPAMVILGENDAVVEAERSYGLFEQLDDAVLVNVEGGGHNSFSDSCGQIYDMGGLDVLVELIGADQVARANDGCVPPYVRPEGAYDTLDHYTVQFLLAQFIDPAAAGELIDTSEAITPLADFRVVGDPLGAG